MRRYTEIRLLPRVQARTPHRLGLNVELQENAAATNLWDWIADSQAACLREFHPEVELRCRPFTVADATGIADRAGFDAWRHRLLADPDARLPWDRYAFTRPVPWLGIPDEFLAKVAELGLPALLSLGYAPKQFARPLVIDVASTADPDDAGIDWGAAASAYEYYLAEIWHYAVRHPVQARHFMMLNEPCNRWGWWYLPEEFAAVGSDWWTTLSWNDDLPAGQRALGERYFTLVAIQHAVLCRLARQALDDVTAVLAARGRQVQLRLSGPTDVIWEQFWSRSGRQLDACDWHHYHPDPATFRLGYRAVEAAAASLGKQTMISEFGRLSGGTPITEMLFGMPQSLEVADLLMEVLALADPHGPGLGDATFYLLSFPATHRNYKQLVYGSMDTLDWSGRDRPMWGRGEAWRPTGEEQQLRWPTPAYHIFRMLARACQGGPHAVLDAGWLNPTSAAPHDIPAGLRVQVVDQGARVVVNLLNRSAAACPGLRLDPAALGRACACRLVRAVTLEHADRLLELLPGDGAVTLDVPAQSLVQVVFDSVAWHRAGALRLEERTHGPGDSAALGLWQTTRLHAIATIDGVEIDASTWAVQWDSAQDQLVRAGQGGLIQRLRAVGEPVVITAAIPGVVSRTVTIR
jgi:hypothetical protein